MDATSGGLQINSSGENVRKDADERETAEKRAAPESQLLDRATKVCQGIRDWIRVSMESGNKRETKEEFRNRVLWLGDISLEAVRLQHDIAEWRDAGERTKDA